MFGRSLWRLERKYHNSVHLDHLYFPTGKRKQREFVSVWSGLALAVKLKYEIHAWPYFGQLLLKRLQGIDHSIESSNKLNLISIILKRCEALDLQYMKTSYAGILPFCGKSLTQLSMKSSLQKPLVVAALTVDRFAQEFGTIENHIVKMPEG